MALHQRQHILFVDSDADARSVTAAMLEHMGYSVRAETNGVKALQAFSEEPDRFNLALIEHRMADITGLELARGFRRIRRGFPVVFYTAYLDESSAKQVRTVSTARRVIVKPATMKELGDALQAALHEGVRIKTEP
jgi:CheY-like chemotaxis protein